MGRIVVGVDGSPGADAALRFAIGEARLRGAGLRIVYAWEVPAALWSAGYVPVDVSAEYEQAAMRTIEESLARVPADTSGIPIEPQARRGQPAQELLEASVGADLLVVGSRGRGGFASLMLGSVSQQVAHHAECPVVIVRAPQ